jgi:hypothetical protein
VFDGCVFPVYLVPEQSNDLVLVSKHFGQVLAERGKAAVAVVLGFVLAHREAAHAAGVAPLALQLLMLDHVNTLNHLKTIDAWHLEVRADGLVHVYFPLDALGLTLGVGHALHHCVLALLVMD